MSTPDNKPIDNKPIDNKPIDNKPMDNKSMDNKPIDNKPIDNKHCNICRKYSSFLHECKCKNKYCNSHILPEIHKCPKLNEFRQEAFNKNKELLLKNAIGPKPQIIAL